ncbi:MAG: metallophosphoesterase family protein [Candidatus Competibacteraceae bacterium]|jgi:3',5'-cyclic AMP phosphodiesterase CpdA|nr:metallophosphoesterase family protein [Candidatus Competibacteraceae bacterium]
MLELMHFSDLHFGKHFLPPVAEALLKACNQLQPPLMVISGDLTQRAKREEFRQAREFFDRLPDVPRILIPGNHDVPLYRIWERISNPHGNYQEFISPTLNSKLRLDNAMIVGLDSTDPHRAITNGRITSEQLDFCAEAFEGLPPEIARIVVLHHHLIPAPGYKSIAPMPQAKRALDLFTQWRVDLILAGHLHRAYVGNSLDVYSGKERDHGIIIVQCGTSTSRRGRGLEREKNTFNWVRLRTATIEVEHFMYFADQEAFSPVSRHEFARPRRGWLQEGIVRDSNSA